MSICFCCSGVTGSFLLALDDGINHADCGDQEGPLRFHQLQIGAVDAVAVFDGIDSGGDSVLDAFGSGGVGGDFESLFMGFFDDDVDFVDGERGMAPVGVDFDEVGAVANLFADGAAGLFDAADHLSSGGKIREVWRNAERVVLTNSRDGAGRHLHARAFGESLINGIAQGNIGVAGAFALDVADGGVSGLQSDAGVVGTFEGTEGLRFGGEIKDVAVVAFGDARHDVSVAIDEPGEKRDATEINDLGGFGRVRLDVGGFADFLDAIAFDPECGVFEIDAFADVEEAGGFQDGGGRRRRCGILCQGDQGEREEGDDGCVLHGPLCYHSREDRTSGVE